MASVLRKAYVKVLPDTSTFDQELKERLAKIKADSEGDKVAKTFTSSLTRRIDRDLKAFHLPKLDLDADPRGVLKAVETSIREVEKLRDNADSIELRLKANKSLGDLTRFKKSIGDIGPEAAEGFAARFGGRVGPLMASLPLSPGVAAAAGAAAAVAAPIVGGTLAAAVVGGAGIGGIIGGVLLVKKDPRVAKAGEDLGNALLGDLRSRADSFVEPVLASIDRIHDGFADMGSDLDRVFSSSRLVEPLVEGAVSGAKNLVRGVADAVEEADPVVQAFADSLDQIGDATGDALTLLSGDAKEGASAFRDLTGAITNLITTGSYMVHFLAETKGHLDSLDVAIDRGRYQLEEWGYYVDLTADGFKAGSEQAEAYERATIGTATAADVATLRTADMSDAQIRALDSSGHLTEVMREMEPSVRAAAAALEAQADSAYVVATAQGRLDQMLGISTQKMDFQKSMADELGKAHDRLFGAAIRQTDANESYQASWDKLSDSVSKNSSSLNIHTEAGRTNRDSLEALLGANNELYLSNINAGVSIDKARAKHEARTESVRKEAVRLGLNKTETEKLIATYGRIPANKTTDLAMTGLKGVQNALTDLYIAQQALARGITFKQAEGSFRNQLQGFFSAGRLADGGEVGGSSPHSRADNIPAWLTAKEWVQPVAAVDYYGTGFMESVRTRQFPRSLAKGLADGGPAWPRSVDMPITASKTFVMSKEEALKRVTPAVPDGGRTDQFMIRVLRAAFPALSLISGFREGSRTLTGNQSYHALGRAVDYPANRAMAQWVNANYMARTKELITPWNDLNIHNGSRHTYTGAVWNQHNFAGGNAHNHWAMDNGGFLMPGWNPPIYNGTGRPEPVTPGADMDKVIAGLGAVELGPRTIGALAAAIAGEMGTAISEGNRAIKRRVAAGSGNR